jgi:uncharacterized protein (TIGR02996 family)
MPASFTGAPMQPYTDEELLLIDAIHAAPHDDRPRLAYADWLEGHDGGDYAEFIRLQCQKPYIGLSNRDRSSPQKSHSWDFPWEDETAEERLQRLLAILPGIYRTDRFAGLAVKVGREARKKLPLPFPADGDLYFS